MPKLRRAHNTRIETLLLEQQDSASLLVFLDEIQRCGINTVTKSGGARPVREHMAKVRITAAAEHFLAHHSVTGVAFHFDFRLVDGRPKTRPSRSRMIF